MNELDPVAAADAVLAPRWILTALSLLGELVLVTVTIGIIAAMWLPAYLTGLPADRQLPEPAHDGPVGAAPHFH